MGFIYSTASISLISLAILSNSFLRAISSPAALTSLKRQPRVGVKTKTRYLLPQTLTILYQRIFWMALLVKLLIDSHE